MEFLFLYKARYKDMIALSPRQIGGYLSKSRNFILNSQNSGGMLHGGALDLESVLVKKEGRISKKSMKDSDDRGIISYAKIAATDFEKAIDLAQNDPCLDNSGWEIEIYPVLE